MEVYVLMGHVHYESDELLGVYHTQADAEFARDEYKRGDDQAHWFNSYSIERRVIGARAKWEY